MKVRRSKSKAASGSLFLPSSFTTSRKAWRWAYLFQQKTCRSVCRSRLPLLCRTFRKVWRSYSLFARLTFTREGSGDRSVLGLMEPVGALFGVSLAGGLGYVYPLGLALSAGAMMFVVFHEVIPETHRRGHHSTATIGLMCGFGLMMILEKIFS